MPIIILGHRGMGPTSKVYEQQYLPSNVLPENSLIAFQSAIDDGAQGIEMDVYLTIDNEVVVSRDDILDRNVDGYHSCWSPKEIPVLGRISEKTLAELQDAKYSLGHDQNIPSLRSVINLIIAKNKTSSDKLKINIELQGENFLIAKYTWDIIREYVEDAVYNLDYNDFVVNSFNSKLLASFRAAQQEQGLAHKVDLMLGVYTANMFGKEELLPGWIPVELLEGAPKLDANRLPIPKSEVDANYVTYLIKHCQQQGINYLDIICSDLRANLIELCSQQQMGLSMACNMIRARAEYDLWYKDASSQPISDVNLELSQLQQIYMLAQQYPDCTFYYKCDHLKESLALLSKLDEFFAKSDKDLQIKTSSNILAFSVTSSEAGEASLHEQSLRLTRETRG